MVLRETIVRGCDAPPVLQPGEEALDQVWAAIGSPIEWKARFEWR
jgi:hypothetical protein